MDKLDNDTLLRIMAEMKISHNKTITEIVRDTTRRIDKLEIESEAYKQLLTDWNITEKIIGTARCFQCKDSFVNYTQPNLNGEEDEPCDTQFHTCQACRETFCYGCTNFSHEDCYNCKKKSGYFDRLNASLIID